MKDYVIKVYEGVGSQQKTIHIINVPEKHRRGGWYRQMLSFSGFKDRAINRWYHFWREKHYEDQPHARVRFHDYDEVSERIWKEAREAYGIERPEPIEINHESMWDFYDYIGYNHKNKSVKQIDEVLIVGLDEVSSWVN